MVKHRVLTGLFSQNICGKAKLRENRQNWHCDISNNKIGKLTFKYLKTDIETGRAGKVLKSFYRWKESGFPCLLN
jgi:hypothetical protein